MAKKKNFFDAEFEIELINIYLQDSEKRQRLMNNGLWLCCVLITASLVVLACKI